MNLDVFSNKYVYAKKNFHNVLEKWYHIIKSARFYFLKFLNDYAKKKGTDVLSIITILEQKSPEYSDIKKKLVSIEQQIDVLFASTSDLIITLPNGRNTSQQTDNLRLIMYCLINAIKKVKNGDYEIINLTVGDTNFMTSEPMSYNADSRYIKDVFEGGVKINIDLTVSNSPTPTTFIGLTGDYSFGFEKQGWTSTHPIYNIYGNNVKILNGFMDEYYKKMKELFNVQKSGGKYRGIFVRKLDKLFKEEIELYRRIIELIRQHRIL